MGNCHDPASRALVSDLFATMGAEIGLFSLFEQLIAKLAAAVRSKSWPELENVVRMLDETGGKIIETENRRDDEYEGLMKARGFTGRKSLRDFLPFLDLEERNELLVLTNRLRAEVLKVKANSRGLGYYLQSVSLLVRNILEEAFPHTRGTIYSSSGKASRTSESVTTINREL
jgi:hypothetical protein